MRNIYSSQKNLHLTSKFLKSNKITTNSLKKDYSSYEKKNLTFLSHADIMNQFVKHLLKYFADKSLIKNVKNLKIGFSAVHGTGHKPALKLFRELGVKNPIFINSLVLGCGIRCNGPSWSVTSDNKMNIFQKLSVSLLSQCQ